GCHRAKRVDGRPEEPGPSRAQVQEHRRVEAPATPFSKERPRLTAAGMGGLTQTDDVQRPQELVYIEARRTELQRHESCAEERHGNGEKDDVDTTGTDPPGRARHGLITPRLRDTVKVKSERTGGRSCQRQERPFAL